MNYRLVTKSAECSHQLRTSLGLFGSQERLVTWVGARDRLPHGAGTAREAGYAQHRAFCVETRPQLCFACSGATTKNSTLSYALA